LGDVKKRYYSYFPESKSYGEAHDFSFYRLEPARIRFIGGFGEIYWVEPPEFERLNPFTSNEEEGIISHMNKDHSEAMKDYCRFFKKLESPGRKDPVMAGIDGEGFDLIVDKRLLYTDGTTSGALEIARANFTDFRYDVGPYSQSVTLSGTKTVTNGSPVSRTVTSLISTRKGDDGKRTFTVGLDAGIKPGDTAIVDAEYVPIESVRYTVSSTDKRLELKEL